MDVDTPDKVARIKELNDAFRTTFAGGVVVITQSIEGLCPEVKAEVLSRVRSFSRFNEENDPAGEHDFGSFQIGNGTFNWKIDYYDRESDFEYGSEDPADPAKTTRVLTVMFAGE
jgi:hypothetical protein